MGKSFLRLNPNHLKRKTRPQKCRSKIEQQASRTTRRLAAPLSTQNKKLIKSRSKIIPTLPKVKSECLLQTIDDGRQSKMRERLQVIKRYYYIKTRTTWTHQGWNLSRTFNTKAAVKRRMKSIKGKFRTLIKMLSSHSVHPTFNLVSSSLCLWQATM